MSDICLERAYTDGYDSYPDGDNPYRESSQDYISWKEGWLRAKYYGELQQEHINRQSWRHITWMM